MVRRIRCESRSAPVVDATDELFGTAENRELLSDGQLSVARPRQTRSREKCMLSDCRDADTYVTHHRRVDFLTTSEQPLPPSSSASVPPTTHTLAYVNRQSSAMTSMLPHLQPITAQLPRQRDQLDRSQVNSRSHASHAVPAGVDKLSAVEFVVDNFCREESEVCCVRTGSQPLSEAASIMKRKREPVAASGGRRPPNRDDDKDRDRKRKPSPMRKPSPEPASFCPRRCKKCLEKDIRGRRYRSAKGIHCIIHHSCTYYAGPDTYMPLEPEEQQHLLARIHASRRHRPPVEALAIVPPLPRGRGRGVRHVEATAVTQSSTVTSGKAESATYSLSVGHGVGDRRRVVVNPHHPSSAYPLPPRPASPISSSSSDSSESEDTSDPAEPPKLVRFADPVEQSTNVVPTALVGPVGPPSRPRDSKLSESRAPPSLGCLPAVTAETLATPEPDRHSRLVTATVVLHLVLWALISKRLICTMRPMVSS